MHSNLSVRESSDGHSRYPTVLQVPKSRRNSDLVQEVHSLEVIVGYRNNVSGQWYRRTLIQCQVRYLQNQREVGSCHSSW